MKPDLSNPVVRGMVHEAWLVVIRARAERQAAEEQRKREDERRAPQAIATQ